MSRSQRDNSIAEHPEAVAVVQPRGTPMSHSTNRGLSVGVDSSPGLSVERSRRPDESPVRIASVSETPRLAELPSAFLEPLAFESPAVGVGQEIALVRAQVSRLGVPFVGRLCGTWPSFCEVP
jgi:hypothetical protein